MMNRSIKYLSCGIITLLSTHTFAADMVKITVKTSERTAAAIGFTVEGKASGGIGKSYSSTGPKNKQYSFGYRKNSIFGENIPCGSLTLSQDSTVVLIYQNNECHVVAS